jgi:hypothetical protein
MPAREGFVLGSRRDAARRAGIAIILRPDPRRLPHRDDMVHTTRLRLFVLLLASCASCHMSSSRRIESSGSTATAQSSHTSAEWVSLFDGKTLTGWVTRGGHYDGDAAWTVEDGAITGRQGPKGEGGLIYTARPYTEFEFELDAKLDEPFDSGIFLRMAPVGRGAQVTLDLVPDGEVGAIYSDAFLQHNPTARAKYKHGEWNHFKVRCTGADMHIETWMNGEKIVDYSVPAGSTGFAPTGLIGLQVHGNRDDPPRNAARFENIRIKDLAPANTDAFTRDAQGFMKPTAWGLAQGWRSLFDGKSIAGWEEADGAGGYAVRDGQLVLTTNGSSGYLRTLEEFRDFELRIDFKIAEMTNSGLFLRGNMKGGDPAYSGCEIQILDDFDWERETNTKLKEWQFCGSLYGCVPSKPKLLKPLGEWNTYEVEYVGSLLSVRMNGVENYSVDTLKLDDATPPFRQRVPKGFIGLQRHAPEQVKGDAYAWFRNIYIRPL